MVVWDKNPAPVGNRVNSVAILCIDRSNNAENHILPMKIFWEEWETAAPGGVLDFETGVLMSSNFLRHPINQRNFFKDPK